MLSKLETLRLSFENFIHGIESNFTTLQNFIALITNIFSWFGTTLIIVLLFSFLIFRIFMFVYPYSKGLNFFFALVVVAIFWIIINAHFYPQCSISSLQHCGLMKILKTYFFLLVPIIIFWLLHYAIHKTIKISSLFIKQKFNKKSTYKNTNFIWELDEKVYNLKKSWTSKNTNDVQKNIQELKYFLDKNLNK